IGRETARIKAKKVAIGVDLNAGVGQLSLVPDRCALTNIVGAGVDFDPEALRDWIDVELSDSPVTEGSSARQGMCSRELVSSTLRRSAAKRVLKFGCTDR